MVVLDAAGTIVEVDGSVGEAYAADAASAGAALAAGAIERGFERAMAAAPPVAFGDRPEAGREAAERAWWRAVAREALEAAGPPPGGFDFERFFDLAWRRFSHPGAWRVPADVRPALRALRVGGVPLAVFSNWDGRLEGVLDGLGLGGFFTAVAVSSRQRAAKPDPAAFAEARATLERHLASPDVPTMVGDRLDRDVEPALAAGWRAVWLDRDGRGGAVPEGAARIEDLRELAA